MKMKITLDMNPDVIAKAKRISKRRGTSVSAMVSNYISSLEEGTPTDRNLPPVTAHVLEKGMAFKQMPADGDYRADLVNALEEKFGIK